MAFDIVVDIRAPKNRAVYFEPTGTTLEGDWRESEHRDAPAVIRDLGEIPGQQIMVDTKARKALVHHKMNDPENKDLSDRVHRAFASPEAGMHQFNAYAPDETLYLDRDDDYATFLYHLRRLYECKQCVVKKGEIPTLEQARRIGSVRICSDNNGLAPQKGKEETHPVDVLPKIVPEMKDLNAKQGA